MDRKLKSQVALEFVLLLAVAFIMFIVFTASARYRTDTLLSQEEFVLLKDIAYYTQSEINQASKMQDGYCRMFSIPEKLDNNVNYSIQILNNTLIFASTENYEQVLEIPSVIGSIQKNNNTLNKTEGIIYLN